MSEKEVNWKYADDLVVEPEPIAAARQHALELGIDAVSPAVGAQLALLSAAAKATSIIEIGTGTGVSGLWLLCGAPKATLTSIDADPDHHAVARTAFTEAGYATGRVRLIAGKALDVLPRMNEESYDLVLLDADPENVIEYVEHGLRLVRRGGLVLVAGALAGGDVANPAKRGAIATGFRTLLDEVASSSAVLSALSPAGGGLLQLVRR
ncbi:O-methyltransferase [Herbiconiux sp. L3-i23]|uniref:O-methyltransferase n=1 Tax=Herbiconiux sp. L3-i23 TaxID=2905871 RepID=UPI00204DE818|nr:class I SAM-dependent methyltransferase [Herbiconiux sp. L3-i23]BDI23468.1 putative O-methyltransferase [Herbiconiux sp. L3-i23]